MVQAGGRCGAPPPRQKQASSCPAPALAKPAKRSSSSAAERSPATPGPPSLSCERPNPSRGARHAIPGGAARGGAERATGGRQIKVKCTAEPAASAARVPAKGAGMRQARWARWAGVGPLSAHTYFAACCMLQAGGPRFNKAQPCRALCKLCPVRAVLLHKGTGGWRSGGTGGHFTWALSCELRAELHFFCKLFLIYFALKRQARRTHQGLEVKAS